MQNDFDSTGPFAFFWKSSIDFAVAVVTRL